MILLAAKDGENYMGRFFSGVIFTLAALFLVFLLPQTAMAAKTPKSINGSISVENIKEPKGEERKCRVTLTAWGNNTDVEPSNVILCLDASASMLYLADSPVNNMSFKGEVNRKTSGINESTELYAICDGEYMPVVLWENKWCISAPDNKGELTKKVRVGTYDCISESDNFSQQVFMREDCKTKLEYLMDSAKSFIDRLGESSPESALGIIVFNSLTEVIEPLTLSEENRAVLKREIEDIEQWVRDGTNNVTALKDCQTLLNGLTGYVSRKNYIVNFTDGVCDESDNQHIASLGVNNITLISDELETQNIRTLCVGAFNSKTELTAGEAFLKTLDSGYQVTKSCRELSECLASVADQILNPQKVSVRFRPDQRFLVTEKTKNATDNGMKYSVSEDGVEEICFEIFLPVNEENCWSKTVELEAKGDFFGGNQIVTNDEASGIYVDRQCAYKYEPVCTHVSTLFHVGGWEEEVLLGESVPVYHSDGVSITNLMFNPQSCNWYGKGETGAFTYTWLNKDREEVGANSSLEKINPTESTEFILVAEFLPYKEGEDGKILKERKEGVYRVKVTGG